VLVSLDFMTEVSPDARHDRDPPLRMPDLAVATAADEFDRVADPAVLPAADEFARAACCHLCAELGMHSWFLSIASNVIGG
jgi:hypothetical protein